MRFAVIAALIFVTAPAFAQNAAFHAGTFIKDFGPVASVASDMPIPEKAQLNVRFDVSEAATPGETSKALVGAARFLNMSVENGVPPENLKLAIVVHGGATKDLTTRADNANAPLIAALVDKGVDIYLCGQSAAAHEVAKSDLLPGVKMALSAMHAHALLDAEGYSLNPF